MVEFYDMRLLAEALRAVWKARLVKKQSRSMQKIVDSEEEVDGGNRSNDGTTLRSTLIENKSSHLESSKL
jgi:hypothetical protein